MKSLLFVILLLFANVNLQAQQYYQVATETLNVRKSPSGKSAVVSQFTLDDSVQVIGRVGTRSKVELEDGSFGYVSTRFLSEEFKEHNQAATQETEVTRIAGWKILLIGGAIFIFCVLAASPSNKKATSKSGKNKPSPARSTVASPKAVANEDITEVRLESNWYRVYNSEGKQLSIKAKANYISLCGYSSKLILLDESNWYRLYDAKFHQIAIKAVIKGDRVLNVSPNTITIQEGAWIKTYDTNFKQVNVRAAR